MSSRHALCILGAIVALLVAHPSASLAHDHSAKKAEQQRRESTLRAAALAEAPEPAAHPTKCQLKLRLVDSANGNPIGGLLRVTNLASGKAVTLPNEIHRELNWYSVQPELTVVVPQAKLRIEALHGLETEQLTREVDLSGKESETVALNLNRIDNPRERNLRSGNTHLHLMKMSYLEALNYLQVVPQSDGLDLVYLSHLRRIPDEKDYISNQIVEQSFAGGDLQRLSQHGVLFGNGQEHRHNFGRGGEGFGHVMLLDLQRLIHPISIGPGIMAEGTDGRPLQHGILQARRDGSTVVWCHNTFGYEDLPNWAAGLLHAQNIFDGGEHGSYRDTYYRYLNLGWKVPFSTGTDWFIYDFSRVYVPVDGPLTSSKWLAALREGKSTITNGPLLEFTVDGKKIGDTLSLNQPATVTIRGRGVGRNDFRGLELIHNGEVIQTTSSKPIAGHFTADLDWSLTVDQPGWFALRIPLEAGKNELQKSLFAHTSPVYVQFAGRRVFRTEIAQQLIEEMKQQVELIRKQATFADANERQAVEKVYQDGIAEVQRQLDRATGK